MEISEINEPVKVRADFSPGGEVTPLLLKRADRRVLRVRAVHARWQDRQPAHRLLYFSVSVEESDGVFQLCFREEDRTWWLQQVMLDG